MWSRFTLFMGPVKVIQGPFFLFQKQFQKNTSLKLQLVRITSLQEFLALHGPSPLCTVVGFAPSRLLVDMFQFFWENKSSNTKSWGLYPDWMHVVHLALTMDSCTSVLVDLADNGVVAGASRDEKFGVMYENYREWCEATRACDTFSMFEFYCLFTATFIWQKNCLEFQFVRSTNCRCPWSLREEVFYCCNSTTSWWNPISCREPENHVGNRRSLSHLLAFELSATDHLQQQRPLHVPGLVLFVVLWVVWVSNFGGVVWGHVQPNPWSTCLYFYLRLWCGLIGGLATMEHLLVAHGRLFSQTTCCEFRRAYCVYRFCLNSLAEIAATKQEMKYHFRPKVHQLGHLVWHWLPKNPRYFMNYGGEDLIARSKRLAEKTHPAHMSKLTLFRYVLQCCLKLHNMELRFD